MDDLSSNFDKARQFLQYFKFKKLSPLGKLLHLK